MKYKTIQNAAKKSSRGEISFSDLVSGRFRHVKRGWTALTIDDIDLSGLLGVIGGRTVTEWHIRDIMRGGRNAGIFERLVYRGGRWGYIAGQDYTAELTEIRKLIKRG